MGQSAALDFDRTAADGPGRSVPAEAMPRIIGEEQAAACFAYSHQFFSPKPDIPPISRNLGTSLGAQLKETRKQNKQLFPKE